MLHFTQPNSKELFCLAIYKNSSNIYYQELPDEFSNMINSYNQILHGTIEQLTSNETQFIELTNKLYNYTLKQIDEDLGKNIEQITIIPDGEIHNLNFDNLFYEVSDTWLNPNSMLVSKYSINYLYHTNQIISQTNEHKKIKNTILVGYDYKQQNDSTGDSKTNLFKELSYVNKEIKSISNTLNCKDNNKIAKTILKDLLKDSDLFHFAGHASSDSTIQNSFLVIKEQDSPNFDSLTYKEIVSLNLNTKLVTLSACKTNLGQKINSEGILSLSRAFTESGVDATLGSSWDAPDKISQKILTLFYDNIKQGMNKSKALQKAKLSWLTDDHSSPFERSPANWSNWKLYGDISPLQIKDNSKFLWPIITLILLSILFLIRNKPSPRSHI